jgi:uncharacterized OB-fold protein
VSIPYPEGAPAAQLRLQRCRECGTCWHPANDFCPGCLGHDYEWTAASGNGTIAGRIFLHQARYPASAADTPPNVAWVELDEGPVMTASIVGAAKHDIEIGRRVHVAFSPVTPKTTIPHFRLT